MFLTIATTISDISLVDVVRIFAITAVFTYASKEDLLTREIRSVIWRILIIIGIFCIGFEVYTTALTVEYGLQVTANIILAAIIALFLKITGLFGLADVKAFMAIGIALPTFPELGVFPLYTPTYLPPYDQIFPLVVFTILVNMTFFLPFAPLKIIYKNIRSGDIKRGQRGVWLYAYKIPIDELETTFGSIIAPWMEDPEKEDKTPKSIFSAYKLSKNGLDTKFIMDYLEWERDNKENPDLQLSDMEDANSAKYFLQDDSVPWEVNNPVSITEKIRNWWNGEEAPEADMTEDIEKLNRLLEQDEVWITPGLPFLVPMTLAIFTTIFVGDILFFIMFGL